MSNQNRILVLIGSAFVALYFVQITVFVLFLPDLKLSLSPLWNATIGVFLIILGTFGIETVKRLSLTFGRLRVGVETERYEPSPHELAQAISDSADEISPDREREAAILTRKAEARAGEERSAADFSLLSSKAWRSKDFESAIDLAYQGLRLNPTDRRLRATLMYRLAAAYFLIGADELAESLCRRSITEDPTFSWPHIGLGNIFRESGRIEEAEKEYREGISFDPKDATAHMNLGLLLTQTKRFEEAEKEYREAISLAPKNASPHMNLGTLLTQTKRFEEAEKGFREAISLDPKYASAHNNLGTLLTQTKRFEEAEKEFREAISLDPKNATADKNLGALLAKTKRFEEAEKE